MTIYCPSCGKANTDQAEKCASCGVELGKAKAAGAKKFKGTMMMGAPGAKPPTPGSPATPSKPAAPAKPAPAPQTPAPTSEATDEGGASSSAPAAPAGAGEAKREPDKKNMAFQATMLGAGVTPPQAPPPGTAGPPAGAPAGGQPRIPGPPPPAAGPPGSSPAAGAGSPAGETAPMPSSPSELGNQAPPTAEAGGQASPSGTEPPSFAAPGAPSVPGAGSVGTPPTATPGQAAGWGSPPAAAPPASAPGGTPVQAPGALGNLAANKKVLIGVAAGCMGLVVLACLATGVGLFMLRDKGQQAAQAASSFAAQASRVSLGFTLSGIHMSCQGGGAQAAADFFHPDVFPQLANEACAIDERAIDLFGDAERSTVQVLVETGMADRASSLGLDPDTCFLYEAQGAKVVGCALEDGFKIVHLENIASL